MVYLTFNNKLISYQGGLMVSSVNSFPEEGGGGGEREEGPEEKVVGHEALPERLGGVEAEHDAEVLELREEEGGRSLDGAHVGVRDGVGAHR